MEVATLGFELAPQEFLQSKNAASDHWAMRPLHQINIHIHTVRTL